MLHRKQEQSKLFVLDTVHPKIRFTIESLLMIEQAVQQNSQEITLYGFVDKDGDTYTIRDMIIPKQEVSGATVDVPAAARLDIIEMLYATGRQADVSKMRCWVHSHVSMGVSPSGVDTADCLEKIKEQGGGFYIRAIANKSGDMGVAFYDTSKNILIEDVEWSMCLDDAMSNAITEKVKTEIAAKVSTKTWTPAHYGNSAVDRSDDHAYDDWDWRRNAYSNRQTSLFDTTPKLEDHLKESKFSTFQFQGVERGS